MTNKLKGGTPSRGITVKLRVDINPELKTKLDAYCIEHGRYLWDVVEEGIRTVIGKTSERGRNEQ